VIAVITAQFARGPEAQVPVHHLAVASNQARNFDAKYADRLAHAIHGPVVLPGVSWIWMKPVDRPNLDLLWEWLRRQLR
jgi:hypothetical protein